MKFFIFKKIIFDITISKQSENIKKIILSKKQFSKIFDNAVQTHPICLDMDQRLEILIKVIQVVFDNLRYS
jgi:ribosomal protein L25 (general stress protein Ctc)